MSVVSEEVDSDNEDVEYIEPSKSSFLTFFYNSEAGTFLGRTCCSWVEISLFYIVYYVLLALFFSSMLNIFLYFIISDKSPYRTGDQSLLNMQPGLGFRPLPLHSSTLIKFVVSDPQEYQKYISDLRVLLDPYVQTGAKDSEQFAKCPLNGAREGDVKNICKFDVSSLGKCSPSNKNFGYDEGKPCLMLKINRIYGWIPDIENKTISNNPLVRCYGTNPADNENIGEIEYFPTTSGADGEKYGVFNHHFFPFLAQSSYQPPLVAVKLANLKKHVLVIIKCELLNVKNKAPEKKSFEVLID